MDYQPKAKTRVAPLTHQGALARADRRAELDRRRARRRGQTPERSPEEVSRALSEAPDGGPAYKGLQPVRGPGRKATRKAHKKRQAMSVATRRRRREGRKTDAWTAVLARHQELVDSFREELGKKSGVDLTRAAINLGVNGLVLSEASLIEAVIKAALPHPIRRG